LRAPVCLQRCLLGNGRTQGAAPTLVPRKDEYPGMKGIMVQKYE
jgi:hypothetical protein